uniref:Uncharacterized protein n=1 Tax=Chenopodium quinoa TaxID=63459 RepID=A0A803LJW8_CHEQI
MGTQNTQQFSTRNDVRKVNEVDLRGVHNQLQENAQQIAALTTLVSKIIPGNESKARSRVTIDESLETKNKSSLSPEVVKGNKIPLLDVVKMVPKYKSLLDPCLNKTSKESEFCAPPPKCDDPDLFSILCKIGKSGSNGQTININVFYEQTSLEETGAINHVSYYLAQLGVENVEMLLDEMVNNVGLEQMLSDALNELSF